MANRILLGQRGSEYGLWVSKPGKNVITDGVEDLLFSSSSSDFKYGQVLARGRYTFSSTDGDTVTVNVTIPSNTKPFAVYYPAVNLVGGTSTDGYYPGLPISSRVVVNYTFPSSNSCDVEFYKYGNETPTIGYIITTVEVQ
jgi:hypothetical protein